MGDRESRLVHRCQYELRYRLLWLALYSAVFDQQAERVDQARKCYFGPDRSPFIPSENGGAIDKQHPLRIRPQRDEF